MGVEVLTAVHAGYAKFLPAAWTSLKAQSCAEWVWLVQIDGSDGLVLDELSRCGAAEDDRVRIASNGTREGPATTRNLALGRASAALIQHLDADDELEPNALTVLSAALHRHPTTGYAVGHARDLLPTGELREHALPIQPGVLEQGCLPHGWRTEPDRYEVPVHPAGVMWRHELLLTLGGWPALRGIEDTALLMAASACCDGVLIDAPTLRYRRHDDQRSAKTQISPGGGRAQIEFVRRRVALLLAAPKWLPRTTPGNEE
jgi:glycosyltransferase involved in cell wall biosynthesis